MVRKALREAARRTEDDALARKFREPILQAAFNLQTRLYNIVRQGLLSRFRSTDPSSLDFGYAVTNTLYLLRQYLCWVESCAESLSFSTHEAEEVSGKIAAQLERVHDSLATSDDGDFASPIFRGQQRTLGRYCSCHGRFGSAQGLNRECRFCRIRGEIPSTGFDRWSDAARGLDGQSRIPRLGGTPREGQHDCSN